jgi:predicted nicotinamide N-methyase
VIAQDLSLSHAGTVWDGALCLIAYWNKNVNIANEYLLDKNVLELGSGTGAVGIAAAAFGPTKVLLTDLP